MSKHKDELNSLFGNIGHYITTDLKLKHMIAECRVRALAIVTELEASAEAHVSKQRNHIDKLNSQLFDLQNRCSDVTARTYELENDKETLALCVKTLARVIGGES